MLQWWRKIYVFIEFLFYSSIATQIMLERWSKCNGFRFSLLWTNLAWKQLVELAHWRSERESLLDQKRSKLVLRRRRCQSYRYIHMYVWTAVVMICLELIVAVAVADCHRETKPRSKGQNELWTRKSPLLYLPSRVQEMFFSLECLIADWLKSRFGTNIHEKKIYQRGAHQQEGSNQIIIPSSFSVMFVVVVWVKFDVRISLQLS